MRIACLLGLFLVVNSLWGYSTHAQEYAAVIQDSTEAAGKEATLDMERRRLEGELQQVDKRLQSLFSEIQQFSGRIENLKKEQIKVQEDLEKLEEELKKGRKKAGKRLAALYKFKQMNYMAPLFAVEDFRTAVEAGYIMAKLISSDQRFFQKLRNKMTRTNSLRRILVDKKEELEFAQTRLANQQNELMANKNREIEILQRMRKQREQSQQIQQQKMTEQMVADWQVIDNSIHPPEHVKSVIKSQVEEKKSDDPGGEAALIKEEAAEPIQRRPFSGQRGILPIPTSGVLAKSYGRQKDSPYSDLMYNHGIVIKASRGQGVQAVHSGEVVFADWLKNYGKVVIIDHGERYHTLVAHVDHLLKKRGEGVKRGETIATVGDTGSQGEPILYFEIRHHGQPINPAKWLGDHKFTKKRGS
jgi:septal ring factor EnvC (AmiA/AmiB activator)